MIEVRKEVVELWPEPEFCKKPSREIVECSFPADRMQTHCFRFSAEDGWFCYGPGELSELPDPVRIAAEKLYWAKKTLAENEWRGGVDGLCRFSAPTFDGFSVEWSDSGMVLVEVDLWSFGGPCAHGLREAALAWHRKAYQLAPDEARDANGVPVKMKAEQVRDPVTQMAVVMRMSEDGACVWIGKFAWDRSRTTFFETSPCSNPTQLARVVAFWEANRPVLSVTTSAKSAAQQEAEKGAPEARVVWEGYSLTASRELGSADVKITLRGKSGRIHEEDIEPILGKRIRIEVVE